jgi:DNA polymerase III epsilon subunit-like protein
MIYESARDIDFGLNLAMERQAAIAQAYRDIARPPFYLAIATTGSDFWSNCSEESIEICILESDRRVRFESLLNPHSSISFGLYSVHRITQRMVKDAPTWHEVLPHVNRALVGRGVALYNAERKLHILKQTKALYDLSWAFDDQIFFSVNPLYARFNGMVYAGGLNSTWFGLWRAARNFGVVHDKWHRAREDAQITRAVLSYMASHSTVRPPKAMLPRRASLIEKWWMRLLGL